MAFVKSPSRVLLLFTLLYVEQRCYSTEKSIDHRRVGEAYGNHIEKDAYELPDTEVGTALEWE